MDKVTAAVLVITVPMVCVTFLVALTAILGYKRNKTDDPQ